VEQGPREGGALPEIVAVYDLGGGTFDLSILRIHEGIFELLATHGDTFLGGDDFDRAIIDHWLIQLGLTNEQLHGDKELGQTIRLLAEAAKKQLSTTEIFESELQGQKVRLRKTEFENLIQPFVQRTLDCCRFALRDAQLNAADIEKVVMVGGSTQVPAVKKAVAGLFGRPVFDQVNPYEVVALGAAIQGDVLAGNQQEVLLLDVTPLSLGIETIGGLIDVIIPRNTKLPTKAGRQYTTSVDGQKNLKIAVYQGERDLVEHNRKLGEFILRDVPPMPAGLPKIDIQFIINADGILTVRARELRSGLEQLIEIRPTYGITEEEMALMLLDSIAHAQGDMKVRSLLEARNEANNLLRSGQKFLAQNDTILSDEEKTATASLLEALRVATQLEDKDAIHRAIEELNTYTMPLAHRAMDAAVRSAMQGKSLA
ncbi:MAG: Hsp70 family protein, partial [Saprospiraceae bacterium]